MAATGKASVYGADGTVKYSGAAWPVASQSLSLTDEAQVDEFIDGNGELIGMNIRDKRRRLTIEMFPKGTSAATAKQGLRMPDIPTKITLEGFTDETGGNAQINGDWIYKGGGSVAWSSGQARLTLPLEQPQSLPSGVTITTLTTAVT